MSNLFTDKELNKIYDLLTSNGFTYDHGEDVYTNDYLGIYPNYEGDGMTTIIDTNGNTRAYFTDNYYAILGFLIENHMLPFTYKRISS